ncbi:transposase [Dactylosporangium sp. CA-092794]|uniref:transposase n=1 Tax=Dactylosporangium sp. CA-092794 TaxID=3239929 RepID=UPI003D8EC033
MPHPLGVPSSAPDQALRALAEFRTAVYRCFGRWADTLFELVDALAGGGRVGSVAELTFEPVLRRGHGSVYQALEHGQVHPAAAGTLLAGQVRPGRVLLLGVDSSKFPRPDTRYVPDIGMQYAAERDHTGGSPAVPGWSMQWACQVGLDTGPGAASPATGGAGGVGRGSWGLPVDVRRIGTADNANEVTAAQITDVTTRLHAAGTATAGVPLVFLLDARYCPIYLTQHRPDSAQLLVRLRSDRVFFARPPAKRPGTPGRARKHGPRFALDEPDTWPAPDAEHTTTTSAGAGAGGTVRTRAWHHYHPEPRQRRKWTGTDIIEGTLIRQDHTTPAGRTQVWWLWWAGPPGSFDLPMLAEAYQHRYTIEHVFRFAKQDLGWTRHTPLDPDQAERWTWLVALALAQLHLARPLAADRRLPWEQPCHPDRLSPRRVRRVFRHTVAALPTPARAPKPARPGPGRPKGSTNKNPRTRQPVIKKGRPANTGHPKGHNPNATTKPKT